MLYLSTRGHPDRKHFCEILLEGLAPDGGLYLPERYPQVDAATLAKWRGLPYADLAFEILSLYIDDIPAAGPEGDLPQDLHRRGVRHAGDRAAEEAGRRPVPGSPVQRPHAGLQGHGDAAAGQPVRVRTGPPRRGAEHPGRDLRRHRQRGRIRDARQEGRARLHDLAPRPHEPVPAGADVQPAGRQHPQPGHRGRVRRLPGHRQGRVQRPGIQAQVQDRHGQLDQLGAAGGAGRVLLRRLLPGDAGATTRR